LRLSLQFKSKGIIILRKWSRNFWVMGEGSDGGWGYLSSPINMPFLRWYKVILWVHTHTHTHIYLYYSKNMFQVKGLTYKRVSGIYLFNYTYIFVLTRNRITRSSPRVVSFSITFIYINVCVCTRSERGADVHMYMVKHDILRKYIVFWQKNTVRYTKR